MSRIFAVCLIAFFALTAAASANTNPYDGTWKSNDGVFAAKIKNEKITIKIKMDGVSALYWAGSFKGRGNTVVSKADLSQLNDAIFGSEKKYKRFTYKYDRLWFNFTIMGVTRPVALTRR